MKRTALVLALASSLAVGQRWQESPGNTSKVSVPDEQGREPLELVEKSAAQGDVDRALGLLQELLDRWPDKVIESVRAQRMPSETDQIVPGDRFVGLRTEVMRRIAALPDGVTAYRKREDAKAGRLYEQALAARDEEALRGLVTTRWLTSFGPRAASALADLVFEDGRPAESAATARSALTEAPADIDAAVKARLAARLLLASFAAGDARGLAEARAEFGTLSFDVDGSATRLDAFADRLAALFPKTHDRSPPSLAPFAAPPLFARALRTQETRDVFDGGDYFRSFGQDLIGTGILYAPVLPEIVDGIAYWCDGLSLNAINLITGEDAWPAVNGPYDTFHGRRNWNLFHGVAVDRGVVFTSLEDEPSVKRDARGGTWGYTPIETIPSRKLVAVDASTGETLWSHLGGGPSDLPADERDFLRRITVNSVPLVSGERVYVGVTYYVGGYRHWLCAFDRTTGRLVWKTYVARGQAEQNMFGRPIREVVPGQVGLKDGLLVYSTNIGVITGIDAATGVTRWVSAYAQDLIPVTENQRTIERFPGWVSGRPTFHGRHAFIAPTDGLWAYAVDMRDGTLTPIQDEGREERLLRSNQNRFRHFLGVHDGLVVASGRWLAAFDVSGLAEGRPIVFKWKAGGIGGNEPQGRPTVRDGRVSWLAIGGPGGGGRWRTKVVVADLRNGKALDEKWLDPPAATGNLVVDDEAALVASDTSLMAWFDAGVVAARLDARLAADPTDGEAALRRGQLALAQRRPDLAVSLLERASTSSETRVSRDAATSLLGLWLDLARTAVPVEGITLGAAERFAKAASYASTARQRALVRKEELLWAKGAVDVPTVRRAARALVALGSEPIRIDAAAIELVPTLVAGVDIPAGVWGPLVGAAILETSAPAEAVALLQDILARYADATVGTQNGATGFQYAYDRIRTLVEKHGPEIYASEEAAATRAYEAAVATKDADALSLVVDRWPNSKVAGDAQAKLMQSLRDAKRDRDLLRFISRQMRRFGRVDALTTLELARAHIAAGRLEPAREVLTTLSVRFPRARVKMGETETSASDAAQGLLAMPGLDVSARPVPAELKPGMKEAWTAVGAKEDTLPSLIVPIGRRPPAADAFVYAVIDDELRALDVGSGTVKWRRLVKNGLTLAPHWYDGALVVAIEDEVYALEPSSGTVRWQSGFDGLRLVALDASHGKVWTLLRDPRNARTAILRTFDSASGEFIGETRLANGTSDNVAFGGASLGHSRLWMLVRLDTAGVAYVIDALSGELAAPMVPVSRPGSAFPALSASDLLVTQAGGGQGRTVRLSGRDVLKQEEVWTWRGERLDDLLVLDQSPSTVVLGALSRTADPRPQRRRELLVLDLDTGVVAPSIPLAPTEVPKDAVLSDDAVMVRLAVTAESGRQPTFVRAYSRSRGARLWESIPETGGSLRVTLHLAKGFLLVRSSALDDAEGRRGGGRTDRFRLLDAGNGLLKDEWTIKGGDDLVDGIDTELRDGHVVIANGMTLTLCR